MSRTILAAAFMIALAMFLRHQYRTVLQQATRPHPVFRTTPQESRRKCVMCGGTGRTVMFNLSGAKSSQSQPCRTCNGTGWVDNPMYGR